MIQLTEEQRRTREILIKYASKGHFITYGDLIKEARLNLDMSSPYDRGLLGKILGAISDYEHSDGRPLLSSVAVSKDKHHSDGFYKLAEELGYGKWEQLKTEYLAMTEMSKTFDYWKSHKP